MTTANPNAIVSYEEGSSAIFVGKPGAKATKPIKDDLMRINEKIESWGDDNLEPQHLVEDLKSNSTLRSAMNWMERALYNGGLEYGYTEIDESGSKAFKLQDIPEIEALLKNSNYKKQMMRGFSYLKTTANLFPEIILTKNRKKICKIHFNDSSYCRLSRAKSDGRNEYLYVSANWADNIGSMDTKFGVKIPMLDNTYNEIEALREGKHYKYVLADCSYPTIGNSYYSEPIWNPLRTSGWLEYANQIPEFKKAYLKNASHIKYVVHIPMSWWKWKYKDFENLEAEERKKIMKQEHDRFNQWISGYENAGKSLIMTFKDDPQFVSQGYTQWKIEPIDKKVIDQILGGDLLDVTQMIYQSLGVHATLLGGAPGASKIGAGSGSDQREAYNIFMALSTVDQDLICRPFELAAEYNGYPNLKFRFNSRLIANLSDVTPSKRIAQDVD